MGKLLLPLDSLLRQRQPAPSIHTKQRFSISRTVICAGDVVGWNPIDGQPLSYLKFSHQKKTKIPNPMDNYKTYTFDEKLIEATKRRDVIYNPANKSNRYVELKEQAWTQISMELGMPVKKCKARWASLRDRFRRITKAQQHALQNGIKSHNKWRYYDALSFLLDTSTTKITSHFEHFPTVTEFGGESLFSMDQFQRVECIPAKIKKLDESDPIKEFMIPKPKKGANKPEHDATDMFFISLSRRIKAANLPPLTQMKLEADVLNFTISHLEQIQKNGLY